MKTLGVSLLLVAAVSATPAQAPAGEILYATTTGGQLISFDSDTPGTIRSNVAISGVTGSIVGIDFRPATGFSVLYGLGVDAAGAGTVYIINTSTGVATGVTAVQGVVFPTNARVSIDFNPVPDALRIVTGTGQNIRVAGFPTNTFTTFVDTPLTLPNGSTPNVVGIAYSNINIPQTAATFPNTLLGINQGGPGNDANYVIDPPNAGTLTTVVANLNLIPGFDVLDNTDIDASPFTSRTYASVNGGLIAQFDPVTGFSVLGNVGGGFAGQITSIAVGAVPEPSSLALLGLGAAGLVGYARRRKLAA